MLPTCSHIGKTDVGSDHQEVPVNRGLLTFPHRSACQSDTSYPCFARSARQSGTFLAFPHASHTFPHLCLLSPHTPYAQRARFEARPLAHDASAGGVSRASADRPSC